MATLYRMVPCRAWQHLLLGLLGLFFSVNGCGDVTERPMQVYDVTVTPDYLPFRSGSVTIGATVEPGEKGGGGCSSSTTLEPTQVYARVLRGYSEVKRVTMSQMWERNRYAGILTPERNGTQADMEYTIIVAAMGEDGQIIQADLKRLTVRAPEAPPGAPDLTGVQLFVSPSAITLSTGETQNFTATVTGSDNTAVTWSVQEGTAGGTVTSEGVYTAPSTTGTYHVVATSQADPTQSATATVAVIAAPVVSVSIYPPTALLSVGGT